MATGKIRRVWGTRVPGEREIELHGLKATLAIIDGEVIVMNYVAGLPSNWPWNATSFRRLGQYYLAISNEMMEIEEIMKRA